MLQPAFTYIHHDADGDAESYNSYGLDLSWFKFIQRHRIALTAGYAAKDFDAASTTFGKTRNDGTLSFFTAYEYKNVFEWQTGHSFHSQVTAVPVQTSPSTMKRISAINRFKLQLLSTGTLPLIIKCPERHNKTIHSSNNSQTYFHMDNVRPVNYLREWFVHIDPNYASEQSLMSVLSQNFPGFIAVRKENGKHVVSTNAIALSSKKTYSASA